MEGPGLLSCGDDLVSWQQEAEKLLENLPPCALLLPMESCVPELHAGGEANAHLPMGPVSGASTSNVQHAGDTANLIKQEWTAEMNGSQSTLTS